MRLKLKSQLNDFVKQPRLLRGSTWKLPNEILYASDIVGTFQGKTDLMKTNLFNRAKRQIVTKKYENVDI